MIRIRAGTSSSRTTVASIRTAKASMKPSCLISVFLAKMNEAKTTTMMAAAAVITEPVRVIPY